QLKPDDQAITSSARPPRERLGSPLQWGFTLFVFHDLNPLP
ncbi:MAG: hypothetical protein ACI9OD_004937, partial [Limisphaerales bacterium]